MEKQKRWHLFLILAVLMLTLYNILPTVFYYTKPLKAPITKERSEVIAGEIVSRVDELKEDSINWLASFGKLVRAEPKSIKTNPKDARLIELTFVNAEDANRFKKRLPQASELIPFVPLQMEVYQGADSDPATVSVLRKVGTLSDANSDQKLFSFVEKYQEDGSFTKDYQNLVNDRVLTLASALGGKSPSTQMIEALAEIPSTEEQDDLVLQVAENIQSLNQVAALDPNLSKRVWSHFAQGALNKETLVSNFLTRVGNTKSRLQAKKTSLQKEKNPELLKQVERNIALLDKVSSELKSKENLIRSSKEVLSQKEIQTQLAKKPTAEGLVTLSLNGSNPFVQSLLVDYAEDRISLNFYDDVDVLRNKSVAKEEEAAQKEAISQKLYSEIARAARLSDENILPYEKGFALKLSQLPGTLSFLVMDLGEVANKEGVTLVEELKESWTPTHPDLASGAYPVRKWEDFQKESSSAKKLGLVVYSPSMSDKTNEKAPEGFRKGSLYVIARSLNQILDKAKSDQNKGLDAQLAKDLNQLKELLSQNGFIGYPGSSYGMDKEFQKDYIFELQDYYAPLIAATRENFEVKGSKRFATLPFTDVEQRILTQNKIDDQTQEDLLKWRDEYNKSQVSLDPTSRFLVPAPTKNPYWSNFVLSFKKYFRGDERKILKWGLDLSGGKSVRIGLKDASGKPVTKPEDLNQAVNELYTRINKMGVSERTIQVENDTIQLEFPGSQSMSAADLIEASQMTFHIVNEKFTPSNVNLKAAVNEFLQNVWNEAVVTNRKSLEEVNKIAWSHLGGTPYGEMESRPVSEAARILIDNGLKLANPYDNQASGIFDDRLSKVAIFRGEDYSEWHGQSFPLLFVFNNWALEGANLTDIHTALSQNEGHTLSFSVKRSYGANSDMSGSPRDDFYAWTSQFAEDMIAGTPKALYTPSGQGYRMAVILNGNVITAPALRAALRDNGSISGRFSQRDVEKLAADLKAGSLSFTPEILSEQNISAELGSEERAKGIFASAIALVLVAALMIGYYRFAGLVATVAVFLNILIMWGVLQNLGAAITLPGIAGIVLTIGMAVDANVLVFERIREEFAHSGRIASAIQTGYRKAFSAIFDSNITTVMAALILIQFDSGPIKGFAVTLIIGIFSSMFTALFMTRYFFAGWVKNPKNNKLTMSHWINETNFDFLGKAKLAVIISVVVMVLGGALLMKERNTIFGMDFTGGYSVVLEVEPKADTDNYRTLALEALRESGATVTDVQVRQLTLPNQLKISLSRGMEQEGHPFYGLPQEVKGSDLAYAYQKNPRLDWVINSLQKHDLKLSEHQLETVNASWSVVSGQLSDTMRNNALFGLTLALVSILVYITFRFEFIYAVSAVVALAHDILITMGLLAFFHWMGFPVQIDLQVIGAIMTIIGYSLNDTIIVFDRIREDLKIRSRKTLWDTVNHALNVTLSRTLMTSGTTLVVLLALVLLGGSSIFAFSLIMTIGVLVGTISSLFIASPVMLWLHRRENGAHAHRKSV